MDNFIKIFKFFQIMLGFLFLGGHIIELFLEAVWQVVTMFLFISDDGSFS